MSWSYVGSIIWLGLGSQELKDVLEFCRVHLSEPDIYSRGPIFIVINFDQDIRLALTVQKLPLEILASPNSWLPLNQQRLLQWCTAIELQLQRRRRQQQIGDS